VEPVFSYQGGSSIFLRFNAPFLLFYNNLRRILMNPINPDAKYIIYSSKETQRVDAYEAAAYRENRDKYQLFLDDERLEVFVTAANSSRELILSPNEFDLLGRLLERVGSFWIIKDLQVRIWDGEERASTIELIRKLLKGINKKTDNLFPKTIKKQKDRISFKTDIDFLLIIREQ
jgi:hypothetical protein